MARLAWWGLSLVVGAAIACSGIVRRPDHEKSNQPTPTPTVGSGGDPAAGGGPNPFGGASGTGDPPVNLCTTDSDGDGISDFLEGRSVSITPYVYNVDTDFDGQPDYLDLDSDGDGIADEVEGEHPVGCTAARDTDQDGYPDFQDDDSDGDKVLDSDELKAGLNPRLPDSDGDGCGDFNEYNFGSCDMEANTVLELPCYTDSPHGSITLTVSTSEAQVNTPSIQVVPERGAPSADFTITALAVAPAGAGSITAGSVDWVQNGAKLTIQVGIATSAYYAPSGLYSFNLMTPAGTLIASGRMLWVIDPCPIPK